MANRYRAQDLFNLSRDILVAAGVDSCEAQTIADNLVTANRRGIDSHGVIRLPVYVTRFESGLIARRTTPVVVKETAGTALVDAANGWGSVASVFAMDLAIQKAKQVGIAAVGVRGSNHFGIAAYYGMRALKHNMIGMAMTNANSNLAPWGSRQPYFGTNPICYCIPAGEEKPIVFDAATSVVAKGKIVLAQKKRERIPPTWAADSRGVPTTDPDEAAKGVLLPFGTYKGSALALTVDVLSGVLPGAAFGFLVGPLYELMGPQNVGHYFQAIDISAFASVDEFKAKVDTIIREIKALQLAEGVERIYLPGEIEFNKEAETARDGVEVAPEVVNDLKQCAAKYGIAVPEPLH